MSKFDVIVGVSPDLKGKGWYTEYADEFRVAHFRVKKSAKTYRDIEIPEGFNWHGDVIPDMKDLFLYISPITSSTVILSALGELFLLQNFKHSSHLLQALGFHTTLLALTWRAL